MYYIMDHEKISYKALIQELSVDELTVSHCHTKIGNFLSQFTTSRQPASTTQSLLIETPERMESRLPWLHNPHGHVKCVCGRMCATNNVTTDSQLPFHLELNWVSTRFDMHVVNNSKSSVACETTNCELKIINSLDLSLVLFSYNYNNWV